MAKFQITVRDENGNPVDPAQIKKDMETCKAKIETNTKWYHKTMKEVDENRKENAALWEEFNGLLTVGKYVGVTLDPPKKKVGGGRPKASVTSGVTIDTGTEGDDQGTDGEAEEGQEGEAVNE